MDAVLFQFSRKPQFITKGLFELITMYILKSECKNITVRLFVKRTAKLVIIWNILIFDLYLAVAVVLEAPDLIV